MQQRKYNVFIKTIRAGLIPALCRNSARIGSPYTSLKNLTKEKSIEELKEIKNLFVGMIQASPELEEFVKRKDIEHNLFFDDYGKASIAICSEKNNIIKWHIGF